jgi:hypothetical protein
MAGVHIGLEQEVMCISFARPKPSNPFGGLGIARSKLIVFLLTPSCVAIWSCVKPCAPMPSSPSSAVID